MRTALDHAYFQIVSPFAKTKREQKMVQFPFSESHSRFEDIARKRLADRVSPEFLNEIMKLKPYDGPGGNEFLYLVDVLDIIDRHKFPIPTADYKTLSSDQIRKQVPEFPQQLRVNASFTGARRDIGWKDTRINIDTIGHIKPPTLYMFEKEISVSVEIVFRVGPTGHLRPLVPTLHQMLHATKTAIHSIRKFA
jgi:hypothetical protein